MAKKALYMLSDHVCRECGGRVLQQTNAGITVGGNPVYRCADCGKSGCGMSAACICWCGFVHRGQHDAPYRCLLIADHKHLHEAFAKCGFTIYGKSEIAVILRRDFKAAKEE